MGKSGFFIWWQTVLKAFLALGLLLSFLAVVEILRIYVTLRDVNFWVGNGFLMILFVLIIWVFVRFYHSYRSLPRAPTPPLIKDKDNPIPEEISAFSKFLLERIKQIKSNKHLSDTDRDALDKETSRLKSETQNTITIETLSEIKDNLAQILSKVDKEAERIVQECIRDVMLSVTVSPFRSADLLIVIFRNGRMVLQLARLYQTRPASIEEIRIFKDVLSIVATVNFLNFSEKFIERLSAQIPIFGQFVDDLTQGVGAGLLTSTTGHAAIMRCKGLGYWNREEAQSQLAKRMSRFVGDVKSILLSDVVPKITPRFPNVTSISEKISKALDSATENMSVWLWRPISKGGGAVAYATARGSSATWSTLSSGGKKVARGVRSIFKGIRGKFTRQKRDEKV
jgi:uncharacterized membrane protein YcjF (UPF0283 family)